MRTKHKLTKTICNKQLLMFFLGKHLKWQIENLLNESHYKFYKHCCAFIQMLSKQKKNHGEIHKRTSSFKMCLFKLFRTVPKGFSFFLFVFLFQKMTENLHYFLLCFTCILRILWIGYIYNYNRYMSYEWKYEFKLKDCLFIKAVKLS